jgi:hypothetical protein
MQKTKTQEPFSYLETLIKLEDIAEKKTKIYSRLLTDPSLAKEMEELSLRHEKRKEKLESLLLGEKRTTQEKEQEDGGEQA